MPWYVRYDLAQAVIATCIYLSTDIYLLVLGWRLLRMFRKYGHVTIYDGDILIVVVFVLLIPGRINALLLPTIRYNSVLVKDYTCSEDMKRFIEVLHYLGIIINPLLFQILFMAVVWRLSRIQTSSQHNVLENDPQESEIVTDSQEVTGSSVPLGQTIHNSGVSLLSINEDEFDSNRRSLSLRVND